MALSNQSSAAPNGAPGADVSRRDRDAREQTALVSGAIPAPGYTGLSGL